tara:strand:+ start:3576 stop:5798 length:2223 start_codon:yes stop_codon:yes gene_type:complete
MSLRIIKLVLINIIILNYFNSSLGSELIIPKNKPLLNKSEIEFNEINFLLPKKKPVLVKDQIVPKKKEKIKKLTIVEKKIKDLILPQPKPIIVSKIKPPKKSKFYSKKDVVRAKKAIKLMEQSKWYDALKVSKKAKDKSIYNFIQWKHLLTTGNKATFNEYNKFIKNNSNYPRIGRIQYLAEHKLASNKISHNQIINWFNGKDPLSGFGKMMLGESLVKKGQINKGISLIKSGWITADLTKNDLIHFRKRFKKYLSKNDYIKRADYLAWEGKNFDLKRMLRYLPKEEQLLYTARQLLMSKSYGVDQAISKVPNKYKNDAGLNYDRLKWRRKRGRVDSSVEILTKVKNNKDYLIRPDRWWKEREIISRSLIYKKKYELAYKIASRHALTEGPEYAAAEWMSGWISLSFLNDALLAEEHFSNFYNNVSYPISLSRGAYWLGKTYDKLGKREKSEAWYKESAKFLTTYYGQLSHMEIYPNQMFTLENLMKVDKNTIEKFSTSELVKIIYLLDEIDKDKYTKHILRHIALENVLSGSEVLAAKLATEIGRYDFAIQISKIASYEKRFHNKYNYPIISTPKLINGRKIPETAFILSIIRQESEFDLSANSWAGAKGLMQLMPYTAKLVAKQAKLPYSKSRLTTDPEYNINLGSHYIAGLILEYDGSYPFAIAAYNAGPKRVRYWKKINKNPQKNQIDYVNWIELIKFEETRNYVQRVLENYNVYRYVLEQKPIMLKNFFKNDPLY